MLILSAQGLKYKEISEKLAIPVKTVEYRVGSILTNMDVESSAQAVFKAMELGILDLNEFTKGFNLQAVTTLTPSELRVFEAIGEKHEVVGRQGNKALADLLFSSVDTIEFHKSNIFNKLGVSSHIQAGLIYMAAKKAGLLS